MFDHRFQEASEISKRARWVSTAAKTEILSAWSHTAEYLSASRWRLSLFGWRRPAERRKRTEGIPSEWRQTRWACPSSRRAWLCYIQPVPSTPPHPTFPMGRCTTRGFFCPLLLVRDSELDLRQPWLPLDGGIRMQVDQTQDSSFPKSRDHEPLSPPAS